MAADDAALPPNSLARKTLFVELCEQLERLARVKASAKRKIIEELLNNWMQQDETKDIYPVMRLILPQVRFPWVPTYASATSNADKRDHTLR